METTSEQVSIQTPDGAMAATVSRPAGSGLHPGLIVIQEAFGVNEHIRDVGRRLAAEGYVTVAPNLFYREGGDTVLAYENMEKVMAWMGNLRDDRIIADVTAVRDFLAGQGDVGQGGIGIVGFCMGGRVTYLSAATVPGIEAAVAFYGGRLNGALGDGPSPLDRTGDIRGAILCIFGDADQGIPPDQVEEVRARLQAAGKTHAVHIYPGAGHGFFCDDRPSFHAASATDAWECTKGWFRQHLGAGVAA